MYSNLLRVKRHKNTCRTSPTIPRRVEIYIYLLVHLEQIPQKHFQEGTASAEVATSASSPASAAAASASVAQEVSKEVAIEHKWLNSPDEWPNLGFA